jgi:uncharacterized protein YlxW (UPF0749 family)
LVFIFIPKNPKKKEQEIYDEVKEIEKSINELHKDKENIKKEIENTEEKIKDLEKKKQIKLAQETEIDDAIEYLKNISRE